MIPIPTHSLPTQSSELHLHQECCDLGIVTFVWSRQVLNIIALKNKDTMINHSLGNKVSSRNQLLKKKKNNNTSSPIIWDGDTCMQVNLTNVNLSGHLHWVHNPMHHCVVDPQASLRDFRALEALSPLGGGPVPSSESRPSFYLYFLLVFKVAGVLFIICKWSDYNLMTTYAKRYCLMVIYINLRLWFYTPNEKPST